MQVHGGGLRHIRADRRVNEWRAPGRRTITKAATNERQAVIVLSGGELLYFELDAAGQLQVRGCAMPRRQSCPPRPLHDCISLVTAFVPVIAHTAVDRCAPL